MLVEKDEELVVEDVEEEEVVAEDMAEKKISSGYHMRKTKRKKQY